MDAGCVLCSTWLLTSRWPGDDWEGCENGLLRSASSKYAMVPTARISAAIRMIHNIASIEPGES